MLIATIALVSVLLQTPNKVVYRDAGLGLQFEYPKTWKVRRDRYSAVFEMQLGDGQKAIVQIYNAKFKGTLDDWQLIQVELSRSMKRNVDRQWQEEYLGVPMVLTKISYNDAGRGQVGIIGLLYTAYAEKMHFRLTSAAEVAEQAEVAWRDAMLTLRTISGQLPNVDNPNLPSVKPEPEKTASVWQPGEKNAKPERGSLVAEIQCDSTKFRLNLPKNWIIEGSALTNKVVAGKIEISAAIGIPEDAGQRLVELAKGNLTEFEIVTLREDPKSMLARSGAVVGRVFRTGRSKTSPLVLGSIVGYCEGVYWVVNYRSTDPKSYSRDRPVLDELFRLLFAEKA